MKIEVGTTYPLTVVGCSVQILARFTQAGQVKFAGLAISGDDTRPICLNEDGEVFNYSDGSGGIDKHTWGRIIDQTKRWLVLGRCGVNTELFEDKPTFMTGSQICLELTYVNGLIVDVSIAQANTRVSP